MLMILILFNIFHVGSVYIYEDIAKGDNCNLEIKKSLNYQSMITVIFPMWHNLYLLQHLQ